MIRAASSCWISIFIVVSRVFQLSVFSIRFDLAFIVEAQKRINMHDYYQGK